MSKNTGRDMGVSPTGPGHSGLRPEPASRLGLTESVPDAWRPIETAPPEHTRVLVSQSGEVDLAYRAGRNWWLVSRVTIDGHTPVQGYPTHWMPLPEVPKP